MRKRLRIIGVNILVLLLLLAVAECGVRLFMQRNMPFSERALTSLQYLPDPYYRIKLAPSREVLHGEGGMMTQKVNYTIDKNGFRDRKMNPAPSQVLNASADHRVKFIFLGGSHLFDIHAYDHAGNEGFPAAADSFSPLIHTLNAGIPGSDTRDFAARIRRDLKNHLPSYMIIVSEWNDLKWIHSYNQEAYEASIHKPIIPNPLVEKVNAWDRFLGWSAVYRKLRDRYWQKKLKAERGLMENTFDSGAGNVDVEAGYAQYRKNLLDIAAACNESGIIPILSLEGRLADDSMNPADSTMIRFDFQPGIRSLEELKKAYARCDSIIADVAKVRNAVFLTTEKRISGDRAHFEDCVHLSDSGSRKTALLYAAELEKLLPQE